MIAPTANTEQPGTFADTSNPDNDFIYIIDAGGYLNINIQVGGSERILNSIALLKREIGSIV